MKNKTKVLTLGLMLLMAWSAVGQGLDYRILCGLQQRRTPGMDVAMRWVSNSLIVAPAVPIGLALGGWASSDAMLKESARTTGLSWLSATGVTIGLKYAVGRPRPYAKYPDDLVSVTTEFDPSFPSGHTSMAFASAVSLSLCYPKWYVVAPSLLWASTVGFSRLYLGVHYPSDVLTGMVVGTAAAVVAFKVRQQQLESAQMPATKGFSVPVTITF